MIQNVVLDLGNVMVTFYPDLYIAQFLHRKGEIDYFNGICFHSELWKAGDYGTASRREIIRGLCQKYPEDAEAIHTVMDHCDEMLRASAQNTALVKKLHAAGIGVYYLSNTNPEAFAYMTAQHAFFDHMDGGIASFKEGVAKPDPQIFQRFLTRYGKNAADCVFVDDSPANTESAANLGFHTVTLKNMDDLSDALCRFPELAAIIRK